MEREAASTPMLQPARSVMQSKGYEKITVVMLERHAGYLDVMSVLIRMRHHKAVSRAELIRAFVEFMERSNIDFTQFANVEEMVEYLVDHFRKNPTRGRLPLLLESSLFHPDRATDKQSELREIDVITST